MIPPRPHPAVVRESSLADVDPRRRHLQRTLGSHTFARASQLRSLLSWLGHQALTEGSRVPSEREVAQEVMRRGNFDPQTDSLVRKEMGRLRDKLAKYYAAEDPEDGLRITLPAGYRLRFEDAAAAVRAGSTRILWLPFRAAADQQDAALAVWEDLLLALSRSWDVVPPSRALAVVNSSAEAAELGVEFVLEGRYRQQPSPSLALWLTRADCWGVLATGEFGSGDLGSGDSGASQFGPGQAAHPGSGQFATSSLELVACVLRWVGTVIEADSQCRVSAESRGLKKSLARAV